MRGDRALTVEEGGEQGSTGNGQRGPAVGRSMCLADWAGPGKLSELPAALFYCTTEHILAVVCAGKVGSAGLYGICGVPHTGSANLLLGRPQAVGGVVVGTLRSVLWTWLVTEFRMLCASVSRPMAHGSASWGEGHSMQDRARDT